MNYLISCGDSVNTKKTIFGTFPILEAVKSFRKERNCELINLLIQSGASIDQQDTNGWNILHHSAH